MIDMKIMKNKLVLIVLSCVFSNQHIKAGSEWNSAVMGGVVACICGSATIVCASTVLCCRDVVRSWYGGGQQSARDNVPLVPIIVAADVDDDA
jgi:hypothetical protein